jgi:hypothetical protein
MRPVATPKNYFFAKKMKKAEKTHFEPLQISFS